VGLVGNAGFEESGLLLRIRPSARSLVSSFRGKERNKILDAVRHIEPGY
jgi:hypothetical protein